MRPSRRERPRRRATRGSMRLPHEFRLPIPRDPSRRPRCPLVRLPVRAREGRVVKLVVESAGGGASRVRLGRHEPVFDQPDTVPFGRDTGPSPLDALAATVGACAHYFVAAYLQARHMATDELRVVVEADKVKEPSPRL